jgi:hypothetical protein
LLYSFQVNQANDLFLNLNVDPSVISEFYSSSRLPSNIINLIDVIDDIASYTDKNVIDFINE